MKRSQTKHAKVVVRIRIRYRIRINRSASAKAQAQTLQNKLAHCDYRFTWMRTLPNLIPHPSVRVRVRIRDSIYKRVYSGYQKNSHVLARGPRGAIVRRSRVRPPKPCMTTPRHATPTTYTCTWPCTTLRPRPAVRAGLKLRTAALQKALSA